MNTEEYIELQGFEACSEGRKWAKTQESFAVAWENCERGDWMIWALRKKNLLNKENSVKIAIACAESVLHIYENQYQDRKEAQKAIEAAKEEVRQAMKTEFTGGYVESWWDKYSRNWITQVKDLRDNQIGNADFSANRKIMEKIHKLVCKSKYTKELIGEIR